MLGKKTVTFNKKLDNNHHIRVVKEEKRKMKWPLIICRSCLLQQERQRFVSTWAQICSKSVEISVIFPNESAPLCASRSFRTILFLVFSAIVLAIASIFAALLQLRPGDFNGFNDYFNGFEWAKSGLSDNEYGFDCGTLASHTFDTMHTIGATHTQSVNFDQTSVRLVKFNNVEGDSSGALAATTTATILTNENDNKKRYKSGLIELHIIAEAQAQPQHSTAPVINRKDQIGATGIESREFDNIECIFNGSMDGIDLQYDTLSGMFIFIFFLFLFSRF